MTLSVTATDLDSVLQRTSLVHGWLPVLAQVVAAALLVLAIGRRTRRWHRRVLPIAAGFGVIAAACGYLRLAAEGNVGDPAPAGLWWWLAGAGAAVVVALAGWRSARWWRRTAALASIPMSLLCAALALNLWVGYYPTASSVWQQLSAGPLPDQTDAEALPALAARSRIHHVLPATGRVVAVNIPATGSGFRHREELVYLPPAWFAGSPPPQLPAVLMIGGEFNTPADWLRSGGAIDSLDKFAAAHGGNAPVFVFVDPGGRFDNDTECVNGPRGRSADHLTKDVVPYLQQHFGVSTDPAHWGIVGFSMGGTCAVDLTVMHPELFRSFVDIAGDLGPNSGNKAQTIERLYGGDLAAWASFDPTSVITKHGDYQDVSGLFLVNGEPGGPGGPVAPGTVRAAADSVQRNDQAVAADALCTLGRTRGIACAVRTEPGKHDWPFAAHMFSTALPWLAGVLGTPGVQVHPGTREYG